MEGSRAATIFGEHAQAADARRRLAREELFESQRGRLLQAVVAASAEKGYPSTTIADIVAGAAVSRNTFYEHFASKEECFLAALETGGRLVVQDVLAVAPTPEDWRASTRARVRAFLSDLDALPALARALYLEAGAAGEAAQRLVGELTGELARALHEEQAIAEAHDPELSILPRRVFDALLGGLIELVRIELLRGRAPRLAELEDDMVLFCTVVLEARPPDL